MSARMSLAQRINLSDQTVSIGEDYIPDSRLSIHTLMAVVFFIFILFYFWLLLLNLRLYSCLVLLHRRCYLFMLFHVFGVYFNPSISCYVTVMCYCYCFVKKHDNV